MARRRRPKKYSGKFFGFTKHALDRLQRDIPDERIRSKAVWLLLTMLLIGDWDYYDPAKPFKCSQRKLRTQLGWAFHTIRRYRKVLTDLKIITINYPGGLYGKANLYKLNTEYMGIIC